jgi:hypothetical protein
VGQASALTKAHGRPRRQVGQAPLTASQSASCRLAMRSSRMVMPTFYLRRRRRITTTAADNTAMAARVGITPGMYPGAGRQATSRFPGGLVLARGDKHQRCWRSSGSGNAGNHRRLGRGTERNT